MQKKIRFLIVLLLVVILAVDVGVGWGVYSWWKNKQIKIPEAKGKELPTFSSCNELAQVFRTYQEQSERNYSEGIGLFDMMTTQKATSPTGGIGGAEEADYSQTNVQVEGVDEADIVKSDGEYLYILKETNPEVVIMKAYPADKAEVVSRITFDTLESPSEIFISDNNLMVIGNLNDGKGIRPMAESEIYPYYNSNVTFVNIYSIFNRENPSLKRELQFEGSYQTSRKIEDYAYLVINDYKYWSEPLEDEPELLLPQYQDGEDSQPLCDCNEIKTVLPFEQPNYLNIIAISLSDYEKEIDKEVLLGGSDNVYASLQNLYVANTSYEQEDNLLREMFNYIYPTKETTTIYKFTLNKGSIEYQTKGEVDGWVLNQFSMDEYDNYFRIATTEGHVSRGGESSSNNVFVLDQNLKITGLIENIAPGEQIYSARFMGKKGYVVTFQKVDPFFTMDLSDPQNPQILGQLKIPGYSDYLHPIDENHIIGLGKNAIEAEEGGFAWYQGIKMAIFDVTDFANPKELFKTEIGDRGTDSYALNDHKAFLFDKEKELLVIPVMLAELTSEQKASSEEPNIYGDYTFQGAYVYKVNLEDGFKYQGRITHYDNGFEQDQYYYYYGDDKSIKRALYIDDVLYTVSGEMVKMNELENLQEVKKINL